MSAQNLVIQELASTTKRENTLQTLYQNIEDYKRHINGVVINFESIISSLNDFFHEKSIYFRPYLMLNDQMRAVIIGFREHAHSFQGLDGQVQKVLQDFKSIQVCSFFSVFSYFKNLLNFFVKLTKLKPVRLTHEKFLKKFTHYKTKLQRLKKEKEVKEQKGQKSSSSSIKRIIRVKFF